MVVAAMVANSKIPAECEGYHRKRRKSENLIQVGFRAFTGIRGNQGAPLTG